MSDQQRDDLTIVKGIGAVRQKWLRDAFDVDTVADLANLSIDTVEEAAREEGIILSRNEIASWIAQANKLVAAAADAEAVAADSDTPAATMGKKFDAVPEMKTAADGKDTPRKADMWQPIASFVVEFQERPLAAGSAERRTAVQHMETDNGKTWPGIEKKKLCRWMAEQAALPSRKETPAPAAKPAPEAPVSMQITGAGVQQPPDLSLFCALPDAARPFLGHVNHAKPIALEVTLTPSPAASAGTQPPLAYQVRCHVHNLTTGERGYYLNMETAPPTGTTQGYRAVLPELLLKPGIYKLGILVSGKRPLRTDYVELPKLNVL